MYIARNHAIQVPFQLRTKTKRVDQKALLDCGATKCFIHPCAVECLKLMTRTLVKPRKVQNVDGTPNKSGEILEAVDLLVNNNGQKASHAFFVANMDKTISSWVTPSSKPLIPTSTGVAVASKDSLQSLL